MSCCLPPACSLEVSEPSPAHATQDFLCSAQIGIYVLGAGCCPLKLFALEVQLGKDARRRSL